MTPPVQPQAPQKKEDDLVAAYLAKWKPRPIPSVDITTPVIPQPSGVPQFAYRNNNPGNLGFAGQRGAVPGDGGFAKFQSPELGYQALLDQIQLDQSRGLPLAAFIKKYAPPHENDTNRYIQIVATRLGANPMTPITRLHTGELAKAIVAHESGSKVTDIPALKGPVPPQIQPRPQSPDPFGSIPPGGRR